MQSLSAAIVPWGRRLRLQRGFEWGAWVLVGALPGCGLLWGGTPQLAWLPLVAVPLAAGAGVLWALPAGRVARFADRTAGLNASADTALHLARTGHPAAKAVAQDALEGLKGKSPPKNEPPRAARALVLALVLGLALAPLTRWLQPEPEAPVPEHSEFLDRLDEIEAEARRKGQTELVEVVRTLRERVRQVEAQQTGPEAIVENRPAEMPRPPEAPPPAPEQDPNLPEEFDTPEEFREALEAAQTAMASDDELLREFGAEVEQRLYEITAFQELGQDLMGETLRAQDEAMMFEDAKSSPMTRFGEGTNDALTDMGARVPQAAVDPTDVETAAGYRENQMADPEHDLMHGLQETYKEFLEAYANAMRDELLEAISEQAQAPTSTERDEGNINLGGDFGGKGGAEKENIAGDANLEVRDAKQAGGARLASLDSDQTKQVRGGNIETPGTSSKTGGAGGGLSGSGEGTDKKHEGETGDAGGETERVEGEFGPGNLSDRQRDELHLAMAGKSVATGPGSEFDSAFEGYFDEVERALIEEDLPPMMQLVVVAYFNGLREQQ